MKITRNLTPWPHLIVDDFLPSDLFFKVSLIFNSWGKCKPKERKRLIATAKKFEFIKDLEKYSENFISSVYKDLYYICEEPFVKFETEKNFIDIEFSSCGVNYSFIDVHRDSFVKATTIVVYISEEGLGTELYSSPTAYHSTVEWKVNRALVFIPHINSWHYYKHRGIKDRHSINIIWGHDKNLASQ